MEAPAQKFVLFDFDGVIADSMGLSFEVSQQFHPELDHDSYRRLFEGNVYRSLEEEHGASGTGHRDRYFAQYAPRLQSEVALVAGMDAVIADVARSYVLSVVSSTPSAAIEAFLSRHGLREYFDDILGVDVHTSKVEKIRMLFEKYRASADQCVFITDTLGDMREAQEHRVSTIGVAWGIHPRETLEKGLPFRIVREPAEIPDAIADYFAS